MCIYNINLLYILVCLKKKNIYIYLCVTESKMNITDNDNNNKTSTSVNITIKAKDCIYTSCYCEENVFQICKNNIIINEGMLEKERYAVFISSPKRIVPIWKQKSCSDENGYVAWDYHVIYLEQNITSRQYFIYDFDSRLSFPCTFEEYFNQSFLPIDTCPAHIKEHQWFRVVNAKHFVSTFASDRHHMLKDDGKTYQMPPPKYPPICTVNDKHNLDKFWSCLKSEIITTTDDVPTTRIISEKEMNEIINEKSEKNYGCCLTKVEFYNRFKVVPKE